ncbi:MutS protein 1 [Tieghemiomyces parasiticus]|uniref:MutS protein 1 n=1 Tax=Tieghemiomyces parasiticus TaxID=78921 RepID=A0A9W7ZRT8_9FUNG|nr:MutS protein 1 [Tieghemiomyces parasiticus]
MRHLIAQLRSRGTGHRPLVIPTATRRPSGWLLSGEVGHYRYCSALRRAVATHCVTAGYCKRQPLKAEGYSIAVARGPSLLLPGGPVHALPLLPQLMATPGSQRYISSSPLASILRTRRSRTRSSLTASATRTGDEEDGDPTFVDEDDADTSARLLQTEPTTRLLKLVRQLMDEHPTCVLLTRVGDFYELYYEQADEVGAILEMQVVTRKIRRHHFRFTGFPARYVDRHLETLVVKHRKHVAICEQYQDPITRKWSRRLARIITPGTLIDEQFINPAQNNYLLAVYPHCPVASPDEAAITASSTVLQQVGLAWLDLATGDFLTTVSDRTELVSDLARIKPREIIVPREYETVLTPLIQSAFTTNDPYVTFTAKPLALFRTPWSDREGMALEAGSAATVSPATSATPSSAITSTTTTDPITAAKETAPNVNAFIRNLDLTDAEQSATWALLRYVAETQVGKFPRLQTSTRYNPVHTMRVDSYTLRSLEILESLTTGTKVGSLIHTIDQTRTKAGSRLLAEYLRSPLTSVSALNERLDLVQRFYDRPDLLFRTRDILGSARDAQRAIQKLSLGYGGPADLLVVASALEAASQITRLCAPVFNETLTSQPATPPREGGGDLTPGNSPCDLLARMVPLDDMAADIRRYLGEEAPKRVSQHGFINPRACPVLTQLHTELAGLEQAEADLEDSLCTELGVTSLQLVIGAGTRGYVEMTAREGKRFEESQQLMLEVDEGRGEPPMEEMTVFQKLRSKYRYLHPRWTHLAERLQALRSRILDEEIALYQDLVHRVLDRSFSVVTNCRVLAQIDVAASFAQVACDFGYTRPTLLAEPDVFDVRGGRHPVVEMNLRRRSSRNFISNDCRLTADCPTILLTGPNMGGKSTFLRQNAILVILAQIGSFVPAHTARLSIVDRLFSRVGASDNLAGDQSTFMVEMSETAHILHHATPRSFVIMDEVGRGTATADGLAIAYAALWTLARRIRCRSLVATHYHELTDMITDTGGDVKGGDESHADGLAFYHTSLFTDEEGHFSFVHKVLPGISRRSHGIQVAQLAGFPADALALAREVMQQQTLPSSATAAAVEAPTPWSAIAPPPVGFATPPLSDPEASRDHERLEQIKRILLPVDTEQLTARQAINLIFDLKESFK